MHSPVWCCVLLRKDQGTSVILLLGDLHSFGSPLNLTAKNHIPVTSFVLLWRQKEIQVSSGKILPAEQRWSAWLSAPSTACGLVLLYSRSWCKIWETKIWGKGPHSYPDSSRRQRIWVSLAIFITPCYVSGFVYTFLQISFQALRLPFESTSA